MKSFVKNRLIVTSCIVWTLLCLIQLQFYVQHTVFKRDEGAELSAAFQDIDQEIESTLHVKEVIDLLSSWSDGRLVPDIHTDNLLKSLQDKPFVLGVIRDNKLSAWTKSFVEPAKANLNKANYTLVNDSTFQRSWRIEGGDANRYFVAEFSLPGKFSIDKVKASLDNHILISKDGKRIAYIIESNLPKPVTWTIWLTPLYYLAYLLLFWTLSNELKRRKGRLNALSIIIPLLVVIGFRALDLIFGIGASIDQGLIRSAIVEKPILSQWYGHWVIIICLYFLIIEDVLRRIIPIKFIKNIKYKSIKFAVLIYTADYLGLVFILFFSRELVVNSGLNFDFSNVLNQGKGPVISLILLAILLFRYFVFAYNINKSLLKNGIKLRKKLVGMAIGFLFILPFVLMTNLDLPLAMLLLVAILFALLFDIFITTQSPSLGWLVIWTFFFAAFSTIALFKFNRDKDFEERQKLIDVLSDRDDSLLMNDLSSFVHQLKNTKKANEALSTAIIQHDEVRANEVIQSVLNQYDYLRQYYTVDFFISKNDSTYLRSQQNIIQLFSRHPIKFVENPAFLKAYSAGSFHSWWIKIYWQGIREKPSPEIYFLVSKKLILPRQQIFDVKNFYKGQQALGKYDYAIYHNGDLVESQGNIYLDHIKVNKQNSRDNNLIESTGNGRSEISTRIDSNYSIIVGKDLLGLLKPVSLCSLLIVILLFLVILIVFLNQYFNILPEDLPIHISKYFNLRQRIEYSIILVIMISFVIIALITGNYFRNLSFKMEESQLKDKVFTLASDIESTIGQVGMDSLNENLLRKVAQSHQANYCLYNSGGVEVFSSVTGEGVRKMQSLMPPIPFLQLSFKNKLIFYELTDDGNYIKAVYVRLRQGDEERSAWLSIPYSEGNTNTFFAASDFLGTLLNVYIFLLLVAGGIAYFVANSVTKPLVRLMENLRQIKLGKKNEQLKWEQQDEIGTLIYEYNNMITQLEESTDLIIKSEREGAWRDMAQQVAHEIKNPLTPMKLSIQYLERKIMSLSKEDAQQVVKETANTIIEQIDNLASIASEFSNFAKMPVPVIEYLNFNELITSIHELFRKKDDIAFSLRVPMDDMIIMADKSHMVRVLNNLMQNAIQSIPPGKSGKIDIELRQEEEYAILSIKDNGIGIPPEMYEKVFYPRFTTKNSGMGLGLAMCKSIIDSIQGTITFKSELNMGTTFYISIPIFKHNPIH
ncbi:MAG: GHKL domain-containing protein [Saprospiraceae bacterium]|nr:GHKL domain-containing protein [Saprospiraceae bacterium]HMT77454.1 ATP-binding protein [Saprospiraceae bacterium]